MRGAQYKGKGGAGKPIQAPSLDPNASPKPIPTAPHDSTPEPFPTHSSRDLECPPNLDLGHKSNPTEAIQPMNCAAIPLAVNCSPYIVTEFCTGITNLSMTGVKASNAPANIYIYKASNAPANVTSSLAPALILAPAPIT